MKTILELRDERGAVVAARECSSERWDDPHGGIFSDVEQTSLESVAEGKARHATIGEGPWRCEVYLRLAIRKVQR